MIYESFKFFDFSQHERETFILQWLPYSNFIIEKLCSKT